MQIWTGPEGWQNIEPHLTDWITEAAKPIAIAVVAMCSVIDFQAVMLDGGFPADVRARLVEQVRAALTEIDSQGIILPDLLEGSVGQMRG